MIHMKSEICSYTDNSFNFFFVVLYETKRILNCNCDFIFIISSCPVKLSTNIFWKKYPSQRLVDNYLYMY